jgi:thiol-disulfide isomerase/thioredoxin
MVTMCFRIEFFYSKTCPHCPPLRRMLSEVLKNIQECVEVEEIDAWSREGEPLAEKYGVQVVPTIVANGVKLVEGPVSRYQLASAVMAAFRRGC